MSEIDPTLVQEFNVAAVLGRMGEHEKSLSAYRELLSHVTEPHGLTASPHFIAVARLRVGFCLMDLERYAEAEVEFASVMPLVSFMPIEDRYELYFAYGNTLGRLGRLQEMFNQLLNAVTAAEDMEDYTQRPEACWVQILMHAERAKGWSFLKEKATIALNNARLRGMDRLGRFAGAMLDRARSNAQLVN
ncbi:MAG: hypothetical protein ACJ790_12165 [Myxococcaceae bacterium]